MRCAAGPLLFAARDVLCVGGRGVGRRRMAQRVARGSGTGYIAGARRAEALKEGGVLAEGCIILPNARTNLPDVVISGHLASLCAHSSSL